MDYDYDGCLDDSDDEDLSESAQIQQALGFLEKIPMKSFSEEDEINNSAFAAVTLSVGDGMHTCVFMKLLPVFD